MEFQYYWDKDLFEALLRYRMRPYLADIIAAAADCETEDDMGSPADILSLAQRMKRADALTSRAVQSGSQGDAIMNNFEQTLNRYDDHFGKIKEYDKQLSAMMEVTDNGGPPLADTFQQTAPTTATSSAPAKPLDHATGDPLKT